MRKVSRVRLPARQRNHRDGLQPIEHRFVGIGRSEAVCAKAQAEVSRTESSRRVRCIRNRLQPVSQRRRSGCASESLNQEAETRRETIATVRLRGRRARNNGAREDIQSNFRGCSGSNRSSASFTHSMAKCKERCPSLYVTHACDVAVKIWPYESKPLGTTRLTPAPNP